MTTQSLSSISLRRSGGEADQRCGARGGYSERHAQLLPYPLSFEQCNSWAEAAGVSGEVALSRFTAYCVLRCVAGSHLLNRRLIMRGGCALWIRYGGQRPFADIDFLCQGLDADADSATTEALVDQIGQTLHAELFRMFPEGADSEAALLKKVKIEVAPAQGSLPYQWIGLDPVGLGSATGRPERTLAIRVADIERILAEKLCALLEHVARPRKRGKDVVDIVLMIRAHGDRICRPTIKRILTEMAFQRGLAIPIRRSCFDGEVRRLAIATFERAVALSPSPETTFDTAWAEVIELVRRLEA